MQLVEIFYRSRIFLVFWEFYDREAFYFGNEHKLENYMYRWIANRNKINNKVHNLLILNMLNTLVFLVFQATHSAWKNSLFRLGYNTHCPLWKHKSSRIAMTIGETISRLHPLSDARENKKISVGNVGKFIFICIKISFYSHYGFALKML